MKHIHKMGFWSNRSIGLLVLRVIVGIIFLSHGWEKLGTMDGAQGTISFFSQFHINAFWAYVATYVEIIGGILLILGVFTRQAALFLSVLMLTAIFLVKVPIVSDQITRASAEINVTFGMKLKGYLRGAEIDLSLLASLIALLFAGAGRYAVSRWCKCKCHKGEGKDCKVCDAMGCAKECDNCESCKGGTCC